MRAIALVYDFAYASETLQEDAMNPSRVRFALACPAAALALLAAPLGAQTYPVKPIRLIVPFVPGGNTDILARMVMPEMGKALGQQIVIENRGGAGSTIGTEAAARSAPDGYTLLMVSAAHVINPAMIRKLPYDSIKDFAPISIIADVPTAFAIHPLLPVKNVKEFIALAKARPGQLNYSTAGRGTVGHLSAELLSSMTGIKMVHIAYKGTGQSITDLIAGHVQLQFSSMPAVINHARAGKLRLLAQTGEKRSAAAPDVPTMVEAGVKGFVVSSGFGLLAPAGTPRPIIDRLHAALLKALADPGVRSNLQAQGADPVGNTPEQYDAFNRAEIAKWIKVARGAGIDPE
jgi:tripartite-type tricarboxylate transporter receptor subunit TctC